MILTLNMIEIWGEPDNESSRHGGDSDRHFHCLGGWEGPVIHIDRCIHAEIADASQEYHT